MLMRLNNMPRRRALQSIRYASSKSEPALVRLRLGILSRSDVYFPNRPMPKIFLFDESDKKLIENARSRDAGMFAHVAIDPNRLATQPMANPEWPLRDWLSYSVGILLRVTGVEALPRSGHIAVSTKVLGRIRLVRPELHPGGYHEAAIKQVVDSAPASALVPRMEETTIGQLDPTLSSDHHIETLLGEIASLLQLSWALHYQNTPHARYTEKLVQIAKSWPTVWATAVDNVMRDTRGSEAAQGLYLYVREGRGLQRLTEQSFYVADVVSSVHKFPPMKKQAFLECTNPIERLAMVRDALSAELSNDNTKAKVARKS